MSNNDAFPEFRPFEDKSIEEQADDITSSLIWNDQNPLFSFDNEDHIKKREFNKSLTGAGIFFFVLTAIDMRVLRKMKAAKTMGPLRKLFLINLLNSPFYFYFYHDINQKYIVLQKHLVRKYLILGDELLFKRKIQDGNQP